MLPPLFQVLSAQLAGSETLSKATQIHNFSASVHIVPAWPVSTLTDAREASFPPHYISLWEVAENDLIISVATAHDSPIQVERGLEKTAQPVDVRSAECGGAHCLKRFPLSLVYNQPGPLGVREFTEKK